MRHHATRKIGFALLTIVLALGATATMRAQEKVTGDKLGTVHFPVSCTAAAQAELDRAVALLHSFWWGPATDSFRFPTSMNSRSVGPNRGWTPSRPTTFAGFGITRRRTRSGRRSFTRLSGE